MRDRSTPSRTRWLVCVGGLLAALGSGPAGSQAADTAPAQLVMQTGRQYGHGTFPRRAVWQGLFCRGLDCEIRATTVQVSSSAAIDVNEQNVPLDVLTIADAAVALFPAGAWKTGRVETWYSANGVPTDTGPSSQLKRRGQWRMPWGTRPLTFSRVRTAEGSMRYHVGDGATKQFLFATPQEGHYGGDTTPDIVWVGDLDGDGAADVLLGIPDDNCGFDERLYLSAGAPAGKLLRKAAQLVGGEAACGC